MDTFLFYGFCQPVRQSPQIQLINLLRHMCSSARSSSIAISIRLHWSFKKKEGKFMFRWFYKLIEFCQISYLTQFVATILEYWQTLGNLILSCQDLHFLLANIKRYIKTLLFADLISSFFIGNKVIVIEGNWPMVIQRVCCKTSPASSPAPIVLTLGLKGSQVKKHATRVSYLSEMVSMSQFRKCKQQKYFVREAPQ